MDIEQKIKALKQSENEDFPLPSEQSFNVAAKWFQDFKNSVILSKTGHWFEPHLSYTIERDVLFEWWMPTRKLSVYVSEETVEFLKIWGPKIDSEMEEGCADSMEKMVSVWNWLEYGIVK